MDAYGNLTSQSEFDGVTIRLVSYQPLAGPDGNTVFLGAEVNWVVLAGGAGTVLEQAVLLSFDGTENPSNSVHFKARLENTGGFSLRLEAEDDLYLSWPDSDDAPNMQIVQVAGAPGDQQMFTVDFVEQCWFALNNLDKNCVVSFGTDPISYYQLIIGEPWSNGANQIWRAEVV